MSTEELEAIYAGALHVLATIGMVIDHPEALDRLEGVGAEVDRTACRVRLSPDVVGTTVAQIPRQFTYHGRTPEFDWTAVPNGPIGSRTAFGLTGYLDPRTGEYRRADLADWREFCQLVDALPNLRAIATINPGGVPPRVSDFHALRVALEAQRTCVLHTAANVEHLRYQIDMAVAVAGSREALSERSPVHLLVCPISPLYLSRDDAAQILLACEYGLPCDIAVLPIVGMTSPITIAGTMVQSLAELLATATLVRAVRTGHPVTLLIAPVVGNMRTGEALTATPEMALILATVCQLGSERFGWATPSMAFYADGFTPAQTMFHKAQNLLAAAMAGGTLMACAGSTGSIMTSSPVQLVIDNEFVTIGQRWVRGARADEAGLALDAIARVGPRGEYLSDEHTLTGLLGGELVDLRLAERQGSRPVWEASGRPTLESRARDEALALLASHTAPPLGDDVQRELAAIAAFADRALADGGAAAANATGSP
jgi:trimethylamine--corrinoid protein Co-methyltransferase